jgi:hypothetical protein
LGDDNPELKMVFLIVRIVLGLFGYLLFLQALVGVPYAASDHAWGPAFLALIGGIFGLWLARVGTYGTFSGNPLPDRRSDDPSAQTTLKSETKPNSV